LNAIFSAIRPLLFALEQFGRKLVSVGLTELRLMGRAQYTLPRSVGPSIITISGSEYERCRPDQQCPQYRPLGLRNTGDVVVMRVKGKYTVRLFTSAEVKPVKPAIAPCTTF